MTQNYDLEKINWSYTQRIKHHRIISRILIVANLIVWIVVGILLSSCEPDVDPPRRFITDKGDHHSWPKLSGTLQSQKLLFEAKKDRRN
jgi:hypothetical protein